MIGRVKPPTKAERDRLVAVSGVPCLPCMIDNWPGVPAQVQHVVEGNERLGDMFTYPGCPWHHQGITSGNISATTEQYGPSYAHDRNSFHERYGTERQLVAITDHLLSLDEQVREWQGYIDFHEMMITAQDLHREMVLGKSPEEGPA